MVRFFLVFVFVVGFSFSLFADVDNVERPNFIFMLSDDQGWHESSVLMKRDVSSSKSSTFLTPYLEQLAKEGMRFSQAYAPASVCSPTRISLQTGKSPAQLNWTKAGPSLKASAGFRLVPPVIQRGIRAEEVTFPELLQGAGYRTAHFGKWHLAGGGPAWHGFDVSDGETGNGEAALHKDPNPVDIFGMGERAFGFMKKCVESKEPFFIQMSYYALHEPQNARQSTIDAYKKRLGDRARKIERKAITTDMDAGVGLLLRRVDALGLRKNTYVIFMSDNGGHFSRLENGLRGGKGSVWEGGIRVPFIVRGPGIEANSFCDVPIVGFDLYPTFCKMARVESKLPSRIEGGDISHLFFGSVAAVKRPFDFLVFHFPHYQSERPHTALIKGDYKLHRFYENGELQLYHLKEDLSERKNLAAANPEKTRELSLLMESYLKKVGAALPSVNSQFDPNNEPDLRQSRQNRKRGEGRRERGNKERGERRRDRN